MHYVATSCHVILRSHMHSTLYTAGAVVVGVVDIMVWELIRPYYF